jgi:hypothetical protein
MLNRIFLFIVFFIFSSHCIYAINIKDKTSTDSLRRVLISLKDDTSKVNFINKVIDSEYKSGIYDSSIVFINISEQLSRKLNYDLGLAEALLFKGKFYFVGRNKYETAAKYFFNSLSIFDTLKNNYGIAKCNLQLGVLSYVLKSYNDAVNFLNETISHLDKNSKMLAVTNYLIALSYAEM